MPVGVSRLVRLSRMPRRRFATATLNTSSTDASLNESPPPLVPATFSDGLPLPKLLVFDLDYTLWPFWVDTHVTPPLKPESKDPSVPNTAMLDMYGDRLTFYREVPGILYATRQKGIAMGLASRTHTPDLAGIMLKNIVIPPPPQQPAIEGEEPDSTPMKAWDFFSYREIYPGSKVTHFTRIHAATKKSGSQGQIAYEDMIFFDDESRNKDVEKQHGVTFVLVRDGVTRDEVDKGVREWRRRKGFSAKSNGSIQHNSSDEPE